MQKIGIRHEDKYLMERRTPIIPKHLSILVNSEHVEFQIQHSEKRIYTDKEYAQSGAKIVDDLKDCNVIFGVKEIPIHFFEPEKTYVFFSHVIKGQHYNMPMLKRMMELKCNLIDYEKVSNETGERMIFFGRFAGLAGMINSLWSLGQRLKVQGIETPFTRIKQAFHYNSLEEAKKVISDVGQHISENGLHKTLKPLVIGFTGYGNVSNGAQEIASLLPMKELLIDEFLALNERKNLPGNVIYKVVFKEEDIVETLNPDQEFDLLDYYNYPEKYKSQFDRYTPLLSILMNCIYWDERYPRIITKDSLENLYQKGEHKLKVIGDITCDPDGSIECTHKGTEIEDPVFVYDAVKREPVMGFEGNGILVMAVDILPSELPRESSIAFSNVLKKYIKPIAETDFNAPFDKLNLPAPIKRAMILHNGMLTPDHEYINDYL